MAELEQKKQELLKTQAKEQAAVNEANKNYNEVKKDLAQAETKLNEQSKKVDSSMNDFQNASDVKEF